jgi:hypothetical protein
MAHDEEQDTIEKALLEMKAGDDCYTTAHCAGQHATDEEKVYRIKLIAGGAW